MGAGEIEEFSVRGHLRVPSVLGSDAIADMRDRMWHQLAGNGVVRDERATWTNDRVSGLQAVREQDPDPNDEGVLVDAVDELMGSGSWRTKPHWGQALVTFPSSSTWTLPGGAWHLDHPYTYPPHAVWGLNAFLLVDDLERHGGGTAVVEGSPELIRRFLVGRDPARSTQKQLRHAFETEHPYFARLAHHGEAGSRNDFLDVTEIDGVDVRVVELTGRAGDVVLCHPWALHNATPNVSARPRMMRACRIYHRSLSGQVED